MANRRSFLSFTALAGIASLSGLKVNAMPSGADKDIPSFLPIGHGDRFAGVRSFIAHRGVHLNGSIAGENSIESIYLAKRAGFNCIELDVRLTSDGAAIVMHDETLNRTVLDTNHQSISHPVKVSDVSLKDLKSKFILKADEHRNRTRIPTLEEFLSVCKKLRLLAFIEIKLKDQEAEFYTEILETADKILGRGNYVITSNNNANEIIRKLGINYVPMMGILYQTTFDKIANLKNVIMAISASRFKEEEFVAHVRKSNLAGIPTESHADNFERFNLIDKNGIDFISTDLLAPDRHPSSKLLLSLTSEESFDGFQHSGKVSNDILSLDTNDWLSLDYEDTIYFGAVFLELELSGDCAIQVQDQKFNVTDNEGDRKTFQLMIYKNRGLLKIKALNPSKIRFIQVKIAEY